MIEWWGVFYNALWIGGLALVLAALSVASYRADQRGVPLRLTLSAASFRRPFSLGLALFCLGLLFSSQAWWERALWGVLAVLFGWQERAAFLAQEPRPARAERPPPARPRGGRWLGWGLILAGLLVVAGWSAVMGVRLLGHVRSLQTHLQALEGLTQGDVVGAFAVPATGPEPAAWTSAGEHLAGMRADLEAVQSLVGPFLPIARLLHWLPGYGGDLAAAPDLLAIAVGVATAGDRTFQALSPALALLGEPESGGRDPDLSLGERLLPALVAARPELEAAQQELAAVRQARARLEVEALSPRVASLLARLDRYLPWFGTAVDGALLAPDLLGADGPRTYLLVAQNNQELRPTGGFISGVGELVVENGRLTSLRFDDSYAVDNLAVPHDLAPADLQRLLLGQLWFFRDANWDPDLPTSAQRMLDIYARDRGVRADGVITLDLSALRLLVEAVGPLQVEGIAQPVTGENVLSVIQSQWGDSSGGGGQEWWFRRKDFIGQIAGAVMDRLMTGQEVEPARLAWALKTALDEKHILVYLAASQAADLLRERNWDGALVVPSYPSDRLLVVDTNVGFNKADARIERSIRYQVDLTAAGGPRARLTLTYRHLSTRPVGDCVQNSWYGDAYADMMERCYWNYVRVYAPAGSELLAGPDLPLPAGSLLAWSGEALPSPPISPTLALGEWAVWTAFFALPTLEAQTLTFEYQLPLWVLDYAVRGDPGGLVRYRLHVQKQPGTEATPLQVELTLPPGAEVVAAAPADLPTVTTDLRTDREFELVFRAKEEGP